MVATSGRQLRPILAPIALCGALIALPASAQDNAPDCERLAAGTADRLICEDAGLSALDRKLTEVLEAAQTKAGGRMPPMLEAEQNGWKLGRDGCLRSGEPRQCTEQAYQRRIADLQARYRLVLHVGPFHYTCGQDPANDVIATFFDTEPPTMVAEHGEEATLMYRQPTASGTHYAARRDAFREWQGQVTVKFGSTQLRCRRAD